MKSYKQHLLDKEEHIRKCYADKFPDIPKEKFVDMMLLDAVFIMELLLRNFVWKSPHSSKHDQTESFRVTDSDDPILTHSWLSRSISRDLILLENQIPFSVLQKLYDDVVPGDNKKKEDTSFVDLAVEYFTIFYDTKMSSHEETKKHCFSVSLCGSFKSKSKNRYDPKHFTDLIRCVYLPTHECESGHTHHVLRTATKLRDSGVSFEKGNVKRRLLDITFDKPFLSLFLCFGFLSFRPLRIPQLKVDYTTECLFRNLISFEQCHYPQKPYFCNYVSLIDSLIHTQLDVDMLIEKEVIVHELGSDKEVATLVNGLSKHVVTNSTCYYKTINALNNHYLNNWNHTAAALRLAYFKDLRNAGYTVVGIAVLIYTVYDSFK